MHKTHTKTPLLKSWAFLIIAIITEVMASSFLKLGHEYDLSIILFSYRFDMTFCITSLCVCISYYFIGLAVLRINIGITYAMWEILGVICVALIGIFYFKETLNTMQYCGIALGILGIALINLGTIKD